MIATDDSPDNGKLCVLQVKIEDHALKETVVTIYWFELFVSHL